jgi:hypothetical protein
MTRAFTPGAATWNTYDGVHPWSTLLRLAGHRYRAGDVLSVKLTAAGYRQERARIFFRNGKRPLVLG